GPASWGRAFRPLISGVWFGRARDHRAAEDGQRNDEAAAVFGADGAFDSDLTRSALAAFGQPVLLLAGEYDLNSPPPAMAEFAGLFPDARYVVQPRAGHFPWLDDPGRFVTTAMTFLG
ncbi:alpha/beta fold hydrolase, partial [Streptomyces sp. NPDC054794]